ncbi:MAG: DUF4129 domain-containing protein [Nitrososphaerota archaeon]
MKAVQVELILSAGIILILSASVAAFIVNASGIHFASFSGTPIQPPGRGGSIIVNPTQGQGESNTDAGILMLGALLLLTAFLMTWIRDRLVTSLKEMLLILFLALLGTFTYGMLTLLVHFPGFNFDLYELQYFLISIIVLLAILSSTYVRRHKTAAYIMPGDFQKNEEEREASKAEDIFSLAYSEKDEMRKKVYLCYGRLISAAQKMGIKEVLTLTPREYLNEIEKNSPKIYPEAMTLTSAFEEARYSIYPIDEGKVSAAITSVKKIEEKLLGTDWVGG